MKDYDILWQNMTDYEILWQFMADYDWLWQFMTDYDNLGTALFSMFIPGVNPLEYIFSGIKQDAKPQQSLSIYLYIFLTIFCNKARCTTLTKSNIILNKSSLRKSELHNLRKVSVSNYISS